MIVYEGHIRLYLKNENEAREAIERHYWLRAFEIKQKLRRKKLKSTFKKEILPYP